MATDLSGANGAKFVYDNRLRCFVDEKYEVNYVDYKYKSEIRSTMIRWLHSRNTQFTLVGLLLFDVTLLFITVFLDAHFPTCKNILSDLQCVSETDSSVLAGAEVDCSSSRPYGVKSTLGILYVASLMVLIIFEIEINLMIVTLGPLQWLRNISYIFDWSIITMSLVLEILLHETEDQSISGALIFARVWRLIRIGHGLFLTKRRQYLAAIVEGDEERYESEIWDEDAIEKKESPSL